LAGLTLSAPCVFVFWTTRYAFYLEHSPGSAALGALLYSALVLSGTLLIFRHGLLSAFTAFIVIALGAAPTAVFMLVRLKPVLNRKSNPGLSGVWSEHWRYGRWVLGTATMRWVPGNILFALTGSLLGMAEVGGLRALLNLSLPVLQAANSFSNLVQPYISGIYGREGLRATRRPVSLVTLLYFGEGVVYWALLTVCKGPIMRFLYGGKFMEHAFLVPWVTLGALLSVCAYAPVIGLRAIQSPSSVFAAYTTSSIVAIALGVAATWALGLPGAIGSYVVSAATVLAAATYSFRRKARISPGVSDER
jgi:O-antigen/teichoic acid export membrane protein